MPLTWRERLDQRPSLWQFNHWPVITIDTVPPKRRKTFFRNQQIVTNVLSGKLLKNVALEHSVSPGLVTQLLNRCLGGDEEMPPNLTKGLIPFVVLKDKQRRLPLPTLAKPQGTHCAFRALLQEVAGLREELDEVILAKLKDTQNAQSLTPQGFHGVFKRLLAEAHWPADHYPYTSPTLAYESLRRYLHNREDELRIARQSRRKTSTPLMNFSTLYRALHTTQTDEHLLDMSNNVHLEFNDELIPLRLARASVMVTIDVDTHCIHGFHLALTRHPNQQDMLTLFDNCIRPWQPMTLTTPGLSYMKGACFPSGLTGAFPITFGTMQLDNALMHMAESVTDFVCDKQGGTTSLGHPATPTIRALVESVFNYIAKHATHRFSSTSGSSPTDPKKESRKNQKRIPTVSLRTLEEALSIILTQYNVTPQTVLRNATPLALYRHHCQTHFVRYAPVAMRQLWQPLMSEQIVSLHWSKNEKRLPYVNFCYERYKGSGLWQALPKNKHIKVTFDRRDIRFLHAYTLNGEDLGVLQAPRSWLRYPHSMATRQLIHQLNKTYRFSARDPLADYFHFLLKNIDQPKTALQLLRVYEEFTQGASALILEKPDSHINPAHLASNKKTLTWHSSTASHSR